MNRLMVVTLSLVVLVGCRSDEAVVRAGDSAAAAEKALLAAGAERVLRPKAPIDVAPEPVVDVNGKTNLVSKEPPIFTWYFELKNGKELELLVQGGKVTSVKYRED